MAIFRVEEYAKATCASGTLVDFQWTTGRYIPRDKTLNAVGSFLSWVRLEMVILGYWKYSYCTMGNICFESCAWKMCLAKILSVEHYRLFRDRAEFMFVISEFILHKS
jgi:hypothetical protein